MSEVPLFRTERDLRADALYLTLADSPIDTTVELDDGLVVDRSVDGRPVGIEVLSARHGWDTFELFQRFDLPEATWRMTEHVARTSGPVTASGDRAHVPSGQRVSFRPVARTA